MDKKKSSKSSLLIDTRKNKSIRIRESIIHNLVFIPENIPSGMLKKNNKQLIMIINILIILIYYFSNKFVSTKKRWMQF